MTDELFPRGGSIVEKRKAQDNAAQPADKKRKSWKKGGPDGGEPLGAPEGHEADLKDNTLDGVWKAPVSTDVLTEGVLGLGCVCEVRETSVVLEIAESHRVIVQATELGSVCSAEIGASRLTLEEAFPLGTFVPFKVLPIVKDQKKKKGNKKIGPTADAPNIVNVSIDPAKVNSHLVSSTLLAGLAISAQIRSKEEKGMILDIGVSKVAAFLANGLLPTGFTPKVGLPLTVRVQSAENSRMIQVAYAVEMEPLAGPALDNLHTRSLMPGTVLLAHPLMTKADGALVDLGNNVRGWIARRALPPRLRANIESFVRPIRAVVLLCQQTSRLLVLSAHPDIVAVSKADKRTDFQSISVGDVIRCTVLHVGKNRVEFSIGDEDEDGETAKRPSLLTATASFKYLDGSDHAAKKYKLGSTHAVRVIREKMMDRSLHVANTKELLGRPMVSYEDAKPGERVTAEIKKLIPGGAIVTVFGNIRGFIHIRFLSDRPIVAPEKMFPIGDKIQCRVLSSTPEHHSVALTARKSMVKDAHAPLVEASAEVVGKIAVGVVVLAFPKGGVLVQFYNGVCGRLPVGECKKKRQLNVGDPVQVRVTRYEENKDRLMLALAEEADATDSTVVVESTQPKREKTKKVVEPEDPEDGLGIKRFGIYKGRVEGVVQDKANKKEARADRSRLAIHVKLPGGIGRLHVSELPGRFLVEGSTPLEQFLKEYQYKNVTCLVVDRKREEVNGKMRRLFDLTLNEAKLAAVRKCKRTVDYTEKFSIGDIVPVFYTEAAIKNHLVFEVNPMIRGLVDTGVDKKNKKNRKSKKDDKEEPKIEARPEKGEMRMAKVTSINKRGKELTMVLVKEASVQPGSIVSARVVAFASHQLRCRLLLSNGQEALLCPTAVCDDYATAARTMRAEAGTTGELIDVRALVYHEPRRLWLVSLPARGATKGSGTDPLIPSIDNIKVDAKLRGFVVRVTPKKGQVEIEIAPGLHAMAEIAEGGPSVSVSDIVSLRVERVEETIVHAVIESSMPCRVAPKRPSEEEGTGEKGKKKVKKTDGVVSKKRKIDHGEKVEMEDPGFDWDAAAFSMDALAEVAGLADKTKTKQTDSKAPDVADKVKKEVKGESEKAADKERALSAKEKHLADTEADLHSPDDFARAVKGDPNSADLWIRYMSHFMGKDDLPSARATAERALKTISYREDSELLAVWCAYLNLEVSFGTSSLAEEVFKRACESADNFKMYKHMASTLAANGKSQEADEFYEKMTKKFRATSDEVWTLYGDYLMSKGRSEEARSLMARALQCVPVQRHVQLISRFAQLEYAKGDAEKGRNLFENLLATYPKKTDIWTVFIDLSVKHADVETARHVLERATSLPLSIYKLRPFYKKWIDLETAKGDEESLGQVREKAQHYLTALNAKLED